MVIHLPKLLCSLALVLRLNKFFPGICRNVHDDEPIVRAIFHSVHVHSNGKLKWQAYDPTPGTDEISVMRSWFMPPSLCKSKAKTLDRSPNKIYRGLAVLSSGTIRKEGMKVSDSREIYFGHAHISIGVPTSIADEEPRDIEKIAQIREICKKLMSLSEYYADPDPKSEQWPAKLVLQPPQR